MYSLCMRILSACTSKYWFLNTYMYRYIQQAFHAASHGCLTITRQVMGPILVCDTSWKVLLIDYPCVVMVCAFNLGMCVVKVCLENACSNLPSWWHEYQICAVCAYILCQLCSLMVWLSVIHTILSKYLGAMEPVPHVWHHCQVMMSYVIYY